MKSKNPILQAIALTAALGTVSTSAFGATFEQWISTTESKPWQKMTPRAPRNGDDETLTLGKAVGPVWKGFGACFNDLGWIALEKLDKKDRDEVIRLLFSKDGCHFTMNRIPIGANDFSKEWYSLDETDGDHALKDFSMKHPDQYLMPFIKAAWKHVPADEMRFMASPWSPPTWMKTNRRYDGGYINMDPAILRTYAKYLRRAVQEFQKRGVNVVQLNPQNEFFSSNNYPTCLWKGDDAVTFVRDYLGPEMEKAGNPAEIYFGTMNGAGMREGWDLHKGFNHYANNVMMDRKARKYVKGFAYQWEGKDAVARTKQAYPEMPIVQSENECGNGQNTYDYAMYVFELLRHYITSGVESYVYWNMVLENNEGRSTWGWKQNSLFTVDPVAKTYRINPEYWVMRHFAQFVREGDRMIRLGGHWNGNAVAFAGRKVCKVVVMNPFNRVETVVIEGKAFDLPPRSFNTMIFSR